LARAISVLVGLCVIAGGCTSDTTEPAAGDPAGTSAPSRLELTDVAREVGLDFRHGAFRWEVSADPVAMLGAGVCWLDYDDDGWMDLFAVNSYARSEGVRWQAAGGLPRSALFRNVEGEFVDVSAGSGADLTVRGNGCVAADFDLDGRTDLYVTTDRVGALLWNDGDGTFTEGAGPARVEAFGWYMGAAVGDLNGDDWPDLFLAGYADLNNRIPEATQGFPNTYLGARDLLYLSNGPDESGRVTFREIGREAGLEVVNFEYGLGALFSDLDRDGDLDLYVANDTKPNRLYDNVPWPGGVEADPAGLGFRFEELAARAGVADPNAGMGLAQGDYDLDGRPDLFVTNARRQVHAVYKGQRSGPVDPSFEDVRAELGIRLSGSTGWGVSWGDLDLDSDLDLVVVNGDVPVTDIAADAEPVQAFRNLAAQGAPGRFEELGRAVGLREVGSLLARGSALADYDNDGDLDIAINTIGGHLTLLENSGPVANWLAVRFEGLAPGAVVTAVLPGGQKLVREVLAGSSYLSSEDPRCYFGLGTARQVDQVIVRWPNGQETRLTDISANQLLRVEQPA
jgi:hypothetical protein